MTSKQIVCGLAACGLSGCATAGSLNSYQPNGPIASPAPVDALLVSVDPKEVPSGHIGTGFLAYIPLVPYGHQQFSVDSMAVKAALNAAGGPGDFHADLERVVVSDLQAAGVARSVSSKTHTPPFMAKPQGYSLHLTLLEAACQRYLTAYGVSVAGLVLRLFGAPLSYGSADLTIDADLQDPDGRSLGRKQLSGKADVTEWLYAPFPGSCLRKMPDTYAQISPRLRDFVVSALPRAQ